MFGSLSQHSLDKSKVFATNTITLPFVPDAPQLLNPIPTNIS
jgi:hypothetical protein